MRILIAEDEPKTAMFLKKGLTENGYVVDIAANGVDALHCLESAGYYDLAILDIMLPQRDGWSILKTLRATGNRTAVLFLTARRSEERRVGKECRL